ncbi:MAG: exopolysaccharide Pel transporter PelG [Planctomycetota bacterium]
MAGIGFELRRALDERASLWVRMRAWVSAGLVASGPWMVTVVILTWLHVVSRGRFEGEDYALFRGIVTYSAAFSLMFVGALQIPLIRRIADWLWARQHDRALPGFSAALAVTGAVQVPIGGLFAWHLGLAPIDGLLAVTLYLVCTWSWLALNWLGVIRDYGQILRAYAIGGALSIAATAVPALRSSLTGLLLLFTAGQAITLMLLCGAILRGIETSDRRSLDVFGAVRTMPVLLTIGVLYNVGIWLDKLIFWAVDGIAIRGLLRQHPLYDTCSFLAYATVVPALAIHLVRTETLFYEHYRGYFESMEQGRPLQFIRAARERMVSTLRTNVLRIMRLQAWVTGTVLLLAPEILEGLGMSPGAAPTFRMLCIGSYFHVLFLLTLLILLYFDSRVAAAKSAGVFFALNLTLPWLAAQGTPVFYGAGYSLAALGSLLVGFGYLQRDLGRLEYLTFTRQLRQYKARPATGPR